MTTAVARISIAVALAVAVVAPAVIIATPAQAHNFIVSSTPSSGEVLTTLPAEFIITTNGPLFTLQHSTNGFAMEIRDATGQYYGDGCLTVSGPSSCAGGATKDGVSV